MIVDVRTIFPGMFEEPMSASMMGLARERGLLEFRTHDLRDWTHDRHKTTDDDPYGGGPGMVMKPEPLGEAIAAIHELEDEPAHTVFLTPSGRRFDQSIAEELSSHERILFVCGRYEGFDARSHTLADDEISIGDYVLTGGELAAMVVTDVVRLLPGVLGHEDSAVDESFSSGLLEYPQYTRPAVWNDLEVPEVLRSGDHARIQAWRRRKALELTLERRPDLLNEADLDSVEVEWVRQANGNVDSQPKED
jgi:tRNA (guanine37-N1)-methyltransferase